VRHTEATLLNAGRAQAIGAYIDRRNAEMAQAPSQHVAFIAHELRSSLMSASLAVTRTAAVACLKAIPQNSSSPSCKGAETAQASG
jgi:signal transduction histidine kinase